MRLQLPDDWNSALAADIDAEYHTELQRFVASERLANTVYPPEPDVFNALHYTTLESVRVVIIGQDPYHDEGQAHGLCFSVREGVPKPPSLVNIMRELTADVECSETRTGCLKSWASQGVLLLNAVLTVRAHEANSHRGKGWERFTDSILNAVKSRDSHCVFVLWGAAAHRKVVRLSLENTSHTVIKSAHPSPLSAHTGFYGSKPFSRANNALIAHGLTPIDWQLHDS